MRWWKRNPIDIDKREIGRHRDAVQRINALEPELKALSGDALRARADLFRQRLDEGETLDDLLIDVFATVREAAWRTIRLRPFDVQLIGGIVLHQGSAAEMKTGEGKTLVATLPLVLNALAGRGAHLVTPNDYLAKVGVQWMGPVYHALGLTVSVIQSAAADPERASFLYDPNWASDDDRFLSLRPVTRHEAYRADITYGTNNEFGFDYLRDNLAREPASCVQRDLVYAIVDEVDNILIDEARTPLIISGPAQEPSELYKRVAATMMQLAPSSQASIKEGEADGDYEVDARTRAVMLTERGVEFVENALSDLLEGGSLYDPQHASLLPYVQNALRAEAIFQRDKDYIVSQDGEVIIVDEFTGRLMHGRRYSGGLHQAIEAKEGVEVQREDLTHATITFQNYFRLYEKLAGMTGTAKTEEEELQTIYGLDVVVLPTNVEYRAVYGDLVARQHSLDELDDVTFAGILEQEPAVPGMPSPKVRVITFEPQDGTPLPGPGPRRFFRRLDLPDVVYSTEAAKFRAVIREIEALHQAGRPVLVGTTAIETSERLSRLLQQEGIPHQVLNAKQHEKEAAIIAQAGRSGAVTLATNMAGRGVDIKLGGDPEGIARQRLRQQGVDLASIPQSRWTRVLEALHAGGTVPAADDESWVPVLAQALADCAADRQRVLNLGGLHVLGTSRHEARRIDNQLRGRAGRQGDPGSSRFTVSLDDELMSRFGGDRVRVLMDQLGAYGDLPLQHPWLDKSIESAQRRVEGFNFDLRKHVLEYDNVVNKQREVIYALRKQVLADDDLRPRFLHMVGDEVDSVLAAHAPEYEGDPLDLDALAADLQSIIPLVPGDWAQQWDGAPAEDIRAGLLRSTEKAYTARRRALKNTLLQQAQQQGWTWAAIAASPAPVFQTAVDRLGEAIGKQLAGEAAMQPLDQLHPQLRAAVEAVLVETYQRVQGRQIILSTIDGLWAEHLTELDDLREGIQLRAYGQRDPLVAYQHEAYDLYEDLLIKIRRTIVRSLFALPW